jgi:RHS repeat-associated protein
MASEHFFRPAAVICAWIYGVVLLGLLGAGSAAAQTVTYIHTDALGSVVAETDANGNVIKRYDYEPYGAVVGGEVTDGPGYTGHVSDSATGLSYMQQRYMDPQLGVFLSVDPVTAYEQPVGQFNRYRYANGNPYKFTDPDGRQVSDPRSCHDTGTCITVEQAQEQIGRDGRLMLKLLGGAAGTGATGGVTAEGGAVLSPLVGAMRTAYFAGRDFNHARTYIESSARELGPTGGRSGRRTIEFEGQGGGVGATKMFDRLTRGASEARDGGRLGRLGDGSVVQMSARTTKDGVRETSVRLSSERTGTRIREVIKVRFRDKQE